MQARQMNLNDIDEMADDVAEILIEEMESVVHRQPYIKSLLRWYGAKFKLRGWLYSLMPPLHNKTYVEVFGGSLAMLPLIHEEAPNIVVNDLDKILYNLYRVVQDPDKFRAFHRMVVASLYSRAMFIDAIDIINGQKDADEVTLAWATFIGHNCGFSGRAENHGNFAKTNNYKYARINIAIYNGFVSSMREWHRILSRCFIECRDAIDLIEEYDSESTFFYLDPPYADGTDRNMNIEYRVEQDLSFHETLVNKLLEINGMAMLSGYDTPVYDRLVENGWNVYRKQTYASSANKKITTGSALRRTEVVWTNYELEETLPLFSGKVLHQEDEEWYNEDA
ncbi:MAG: DNA methyltransferase [Patescibacteria group bacterium]|nr:MAG: DNA methyltransferase [Patescibacteria group bacterium]